MKKFLLPIAVKRNKLASFILLFSFFALPSGAATYSVWPGETQRVEVNVSAGETSPSWSTDNPTLRLTGSGFYRDVVATAYFGGTATVTCTYTYRVGTSKYQRSKSWTFTCLSNNVSVSPTSVTLDAGETKQLSWSFAHTAYLNPSMQFTSDDPEVASVSSNGVITAKAKGSTTIYVRSNLGTNSATCRVTVLGDGTVEPDEPGGSQDGDMLTIDLKEAGTLSSFISEDEKYQITELRLTGPLNGSDIRLLRDMAGMNAVNEPTSGELRVLDLRDAFFVSGGAWYSDAYDEHRFTSDTPETPMFMFAWCPALERVYLPKVTTKVDAWSFLWCKGIEYVEIPVGVTEIGNYNFDYADNLRTLSIPSTVTSIQTDFYEDDNLTTIYCYAQEPPAMSSSGFSSRTNISNGALYVPKGCSDKYWRAEGWSDFGDIVELDYVVYAMQVEVSAGGSVRYGNSTVRKDFPDVDYIGTESLDIKGGETVNLTILPDDGYVLDKISINGADATSDVSDNLLVVKDVDKVTHIVVSFGLPTGVDSVAEGNGENNVEVSACQGGIVVTGAIDGERIDIYSVSGAKVATAYATGGAPCVVSLDRGMYVVEVGAGSFKVML